MHFKEDSDRLRRSVTLSMLADTLGVAQNTILRARMDRQNPNARSAPPGWEKGIAKLARERASQLVRLADELEG